MKKITLTKLASVAAKLDEKNQFKLADEIDKIIALAARFPDIPDTAEQSQRNRLDKNLGDFFKDWPNKTPLSSKKRELDFKIYENQTQELDSWLNQNYSITKTEDEVSKTISYVFDNYSKSIVTLKVFPSSSLGSAVGDEWSTDDIKRKIKFSIGPEEKEKEEKSAPSTQSKSSSMYDFGNGQVPAHRHVNGGGWVADTASVDSTAFVGPDAQVYGNAQVLDIAQVYVNAQVFGNAKVYDFSQVYGNAQVSGDAKVFGDAQVAGEAQVYGDAQVYGKARVFWKAQVYGNSEIYGDAHVFGNAQVYDFAQVAGDAQVFGNADITNQKIDTGNYQ